MLAERVLRTIRRHGMLARGRRVLVALSGGPDSTALTHLLLDLQARGELEVAGAAHLNHALRPAADEDEAFCRDLAASLSLPFRAARVDVREEARRRRTSVEAAARAVRYRFLEEAADALGADVLATGHTRDDQAETFLLRLVRGAGPRGLAGILPVAGRIVRPLLDIRRDELVAHLDAASIRYREDETNRDLSVPRNRIRHELLPYLRREFSPAIADVLAREADIARDDEDRLGQEAIDLLPSVVLSSKAPHGSPAQVEIDAAALASLHPALAARVARHVLQTIWSGFVSFEHIRRLLEFVRDPGPGGKLTLAGRLAVRRGDRIVFGGDRPEPFANSFQVSLSIPGEVELDSRGWVISAELVQPDGHGVTPGQDTGGAGGSDLLCAAVRADLPRTPLSVRSRRPGDRFAPPGLGGKRKKLQDFFVDRKVAPALRDEIPLVVDGDDRILWIVGHAVSGDFGVTSPSQGVILLKARRLGGPG